MRLILAILIILSFTKSAFGDESKIASEIYSSVLSPFCPGRLLSDCPSEPAQKLRSEILDKVTQGVTADQIIVELNQRFGERIRATPRFGGFGWIGWFAPVIFFLIGAILLVRWIKGTNKVEISPNQKKDIDPKVAQIIESDPWN